MIAAEEGDYETVHSFLQHSRDKSEIDLKNDIGYSPLALAVKNGHKSLVKLLIQAGADVDSVNNARQTVLFIACWANKIDMVKILVREGADLNKTDKRGWTPLMMAAHQGYEPIVRLLLESGADIDIADTMGKKAYDRAKNQGIFYLLSSAGMERRMSDAKVLEESATKENIQ